MHRPEGWVDLELPCTGGDGERGGDDGVLETGGGGTEGLRGGGRSVLGRGEEGKEEEECWCKASSHGRVMVWLELWSPFLKSRMW